MASHNDQRIAEEIMKTVRRLQLPLKLDEITEGKGNCFPLSILAQGRRVEIYKGLNQRTQTIINQNDPTTVRGRKLESSRVHAKIAAQLWTFITIGGAILLCVLEASSPPSSKEYLSEYITKEEDEAARKCLK